ncbi:MAG: HrpE/YscL family type III secretion apparatus protein [Chitinophagaceae bacterium]
MTFIKKTFSLNGYKPYNKIITNEIIQQIQEYNDILAKATQDAQSVQEYAQIQANNIIEQANQKAKNILDTVEQHQQKILQQANQEANDLLQQAKHDVQDILTNSEHRAAQEVWDKAAELIQSLEQAHNKFYEHTEVLIQDILTDIIKKLTSNNDTQSQMQILVSQVFEKAKEVEYATLFFSPQDYEDLPTFHIPHTWKIEKDIMMDKGWCRLVGAGGEWKTSITLIERTLLQAIEAANDSSTD